jgi:hypothetical protein
MAAIWLDLLKGEGLDNTTTPVPADRRNPARGILSSFPNNRIRSLREAVPLNGSDKL